MTRVGGDLRDPSDCNSRFLVTREIETRDPRRRAAFKSVATGILGLITCVCVMADRAHVAEEDARVLIFNGMDPYLPAYLAVDNAMRASLADESPRQIIFFAESLDAQRFSPQGLEPEFLTLLTEKYSTLRVDVVVAVSRPALEFFKRHGEQLWPGARPIGTPMRQEGPGSNRNLSSPGSFSFYVCANGQSVVGN